MRIFIVIAALVASVSASAAAADDDTTPPVLESWDLYPRQVDVTLAPATVTFDFTLIDSESGIDTFEVVAGYVPTLQDPAMDPGIVFLAADEVGAFVEGYDSTDETGTTGYDDDGRQFIGYAKFVIPERGFPETYSIHFRDLKDQAGNKAGEEDIYYYPGSFLYPPSRKSPIEFEVIRGPDPIVQITVEEPVVDEVHMGVGNIRGWVVASRGVERVSAFLNNTFLAEIPYGGTRGDVASAFPDVSGAGSSGFAMSFNYSNLCEGTHTLGVHVLTTEGETHVSQVEFQTIGLEQEFIASGEIVDLDTSALTATGEEIEVRNISIAGKYYNARLRWRTAEQGFEIVELEPLDSDGRACE